MTRRPKRTAPAPAGPVAASATDEVERLIDEEADEVADSEVALLRVGYIPDYISGVPVQAKPEEVEAVQVMSRRLVEDYGYPKEHIRTRPQWKVRKAPSDEKKT